MVEDDLWRRERPAPLAPLPLFERGHRFLQPPEIGVEPDRLREARLRCAEQIARAAQLEIPQRDAIARAEIRVMLEYVQPFVRVGVHLVGHEEVAVGAPMAPAHAATQLVELRQAELIRAAHEHRVRVRHVEPGFDDHRGHENVHLAAHEPRHDVVERRALQLAVRHRHPSPRRGERPHPLGDRVDRLDAVVHEVHLPRPIQLARKSLLEQTVIPRLDERQHRRSVLGRRLEQGQIPQARQREMERAGDGRRRQRQDVDRELQRLEPFLVPHTEPMLLIDDQETEIVKRHVPR